MVQTRQALDQWVGSAEVREDTITPVPLAALGATLDLPPQAAGRPAVVPPLWHWLYFLPLHQQSDIGADGHAKRGGFLPPVPLPRRMWAGGRLNFLQPLVEGDAVRRESTVTNVVEKTGRTGHLVFVTVRHEISGPRGLALTEEHDIVYRDLPGPDAPAPAPLAAPRDPQWDEWVVPDDVLLFRYSALTFNGHRIHYDRRYVTEVEGYPGLIVHGPLIATMLAQLAVKHRPGRAMKTFGFRSFAPLFDIARFRLCGKPAAQGPGLELWAENARGDLAMSATATFE